MQPTRVADCVIDCIKRPVHLDRVAPTVSNEASTVSNSSVIVHQRIEEILESQWFPGKRSCRARSLNAKWTNNIDEEDDQTSSWESEPEGENAEELASLETPDEEGEWCWPKNIRVTRWRRRIDSRPAFHYPAEHDKDEQASRGLNHLVPRNAGGAQWTWKKVIVVLDSGAAENVMPRSSSRDRNQTNREVQERKRTREREHQELRAARPARDLCARAHGRSRT